MKFDAVMVVYVFWSRALEKFPPGVLKMIDTQDVFANRHLLYRDREEPYWWYCTSAREEGKGLNRADVVIAIQQREAKYFSTVTGTKVITIGHVAPLSEPPEVTAGGRSILFVGSGSQINRHGFRLFMQEIFPRIKSALPDATVVVAGRVCESLEDFAGCTKLGVVEDLAPTYRQADVVINPIQFSTGLSIKTMEALGFSRPVVATSAGSRGLEDGAGKAFLLADDPVAFGEAVVDILSNPGRARSLARAAHEFAAEWNRDNLRSLAQLLA